MFFMYIHTHSVENCKIDKPEESMKLLAKIKTDAEKAQIKMTGYGALHEHTMYAIIEANDIVALEKVLAPLTKWGEATLIPVISAEQMASMMPK